MRPDSEAFTEIPLSGWARRQVFLLADATGAPELAALDGATLLGERASLAGFAVPALISAGGGCRLYPTKSDWVALNLARSDDRALLQALFEDGALDAENDNAIAARFAACDARAIVARGRDMGLAIAAANEEPIEAQTPVQRINARPARRRPPRVIDLTALWAGPLASHLLQLAGAEVLKVESLARPDAMRQGAPDFFDLLNQGKRSIALDFTASADLEALRALLINADIVIEAARPRALRQLGVFAEDILQQRPSLVWISITGHGMDEGENWIGFGDDCGVAAGLSSTLYEASGVMGFVGDAIADPLTGIHAALIAWQTWSAGLGGRVSVSMREAAACALAEEQRVAPERLNAALKQWATRRGRPFPPTTRRAASPARAFGGDTEASVKRALPC